jgi:hypothetical protein
VERVYLDWPISSGSGHNELAEWSKSSEKRRHGFIVCGSGEDHSGAAKGLKCGNWILSVAVNVMMCAEFLRETFLFWPASDGCQLKTHAPCKLNSKVAESANSLNGDDLAGSSVFAVPAGPWQVTQTRIVFLIVARGCPGRISGKRKSGSPPS